MSAIRLLGLKTNDCKIKFCSRGNGKYTSSIHKNSQNFGRKHLYSKGCLLRMWRKHYIKKAKCRVSAWNKIYQRRYFTSKAQSIARHWME